ncbi:MAG: hypothetical protein HPZ91_11320 [Lentisphaeria bacterium]|nr:hypothetical protein [Lentisphaeria bacterium]
MNESAAAIPLFSTGKLREDFDSMTRTLLEASPESSLTMATTETRTSAK